MNVTTKTKFNNAIKIRVLSCNNSEFWYNNRIGETFWVQGYDCGHGQSFKYRTILPTSNKHTVGYFEEQDVEIIETADIEVVTTTTTTINKILTDTDRINKLQKMAELGILYPTHWPTDKNIRTFIDEYEL